MNVLLNVKRLRSIQREFCFKNGIAKSKEGRTERFEDDGTSKVIARSQFALARYKVQKKKTEANTSEQVNPHVGLENSATSVAADLSKAWSWPTVHGVQHTHTPFTAPA